MPSTPDCRLRITVKSVCADHEGASKFRIAALPAEGVGGCRDRGDRSHCNINNNCILVKKYKS